MRGMFASPRQFTHRPPIVSLRVEQGPKDAVDEGRAAAGGRQRRHVFKYRIDKLPRSVGHHAAETRKYMLAARAEPSDLGRSVSQQGRVSIHHWQCANELHGMNGRQPSAANEMGGGWWSKQDKKSPRDSRWQQSACSKDPLCVNHDGAHQRFAGYSLDKRAIVYRARLAFSAGVGLTFWAL